MSGAMLLLTFTQDEELEYDNIFIGRPDNLRLVELLHLHPGMAGDSARVGVADLLFSFFHFRGAYFFFGAPG